MKLQTVQKQQLLHSAVRYGTVHSELSTVAPRSRSESRGYGVDAFETVIAAILQRQGYWTQINLKVCLTKEDKRLIGRNSSPRWELDVVAFDARNNDIIVVECKSLLDSRGVAIKTLDGTDEKSKKRYKLFTDNKLREIVFHRLQQQLIYDGFCKHRPTVHLGLAAGKICGDGEQLHALFKANDWLLLDPHCIQRELKKLCNSSYENDVTTMVVKLLLRMP
ncbi:MAG TPA: hypothetical protein VKV22_03795 [Rhodanobacteraceae bacterium]|nr:hypothetical protein [Rhodanobacteraceae bacterium]